MRNKKIYIILLIIAVVVFIIIVKFHKNNQSSIRDNYFDADVKEQVKEMNIEGTKSYTIDDYEISLNRARYDDTIKEGYLEFEFNKKNFFKRIKMLVSNVNKNSEVIDERFAIGFDTEKAHIKSYQLVINKGKIYYYVKFQNHEENDTKDIDILLFDGKTELVNDHELKQKEPFKFTISL